MEIEEHVTLAPYTTFHIGGPARYFAQARNIEEVREALSFAKKKELKVFVLGGGSNVLVDDAGFDGLVLKIEINGVELHKENDSATLVAGAGESWDSLVECAVKENLWGIENLSGVPGTVGGAVVQNIGAYGAALSETLEWVEVLDAKTGEIRKLSNAECKFGYRESIFSSPKESVLAGVRYISPERTFSFGLVALRGAFKLSRTPKPNISYKDLKTRFADTSNLDEKGSVSLSNIREAVLDIRKNKFPDLLVEGTAGSFFKNPILSPAEADKLHTQYPEMPLFDLPEANGVKIPLAWLFDHVLNLRGESHGGARLFEKQLLVIAAKNSPAGEATAHDVRMLAERVQKQIKEKLKITIEPEVKII